MSLKDTGVAMEFDQTNFPTVIRDFGNIASAWLAKVDLGDLTLTLIIVVAVVLLRRKLSDWIVGGFVSLLKWFAVELSDEVTS